MRTDMIRTAHQVQDSRLEVIAVIEGVMPRASAAAEDLAYYLMVCLFWGIILYVALTYALP